MDIVPAEGYTQKRTSPSNTNHPENNLQSIVRIDRGGQKGYGTAAKQQISVRSINGR
jgi:hypothetical protein